MSRCGRVATVAGADRGQVVRGPRGSRARRLPVEDRHLEISASGPGSPTRQVRASAPLGRSRASCVHVPGASNATNTACQSAWTCLARNSECPGDGERYRPGGDDEVPRILEGAAVSVDDLEPRLPRAHGGAPPRGRLRETERSSPSSLPLRRPPAPAARRRRPRAPRSCRSPAPRCRTRSLPSRRSRRSRSR